MEGGVCAWVPYNPENKIVKQNTTPARTLNANEVFMREVRRCGWGAGLACGAMEGSDGHRDFYRILLEQNQKNGKNSLTLER